MRARSLIVLMLATLIFVTILGASVGRAQDMFGTGESYWGEHMMNAIFNLWPAVAIIVFGFLLMGGMVGFYPLDRATVLMLFGTSAYLIYHFYWQPAHIASGLHFLGL
jgi:hypothetical protein